MKLLKKLLPPEGGTSLLRGGNGLSRPRTGSSSYHHPESLKLGGFKYLPRGGETSAPKKG